MRAWLTHAIVGILFFIIGFERTANSRTCSPRAHQKTNNFFQLAQEIGTDKVTSHWYETLYSKYFENRQMDALKLFEIGLGCNMAYGPGRSALLWRKFFPNAEIWFAEYDKECLTKHTAHLHDLKVNAVAGDQADIETLRSWIQKTGGAFDFIIDDGGHTSMQMFNSFIELFDKALAPGGTYFIEDILASRMKEFIDGDKQHIMIEVIKDWIEGLVMDPFAEWGITPEQFLERQSRGPAHYKPKWPLPAGIKTIECAKGICAITKCQSMETRCTYFYSANNV